MPPRSTRKGWRHEQDRPGAQYRRLRADDRRAGESLRPRQIHRRHRAAGPTGGPHLSQPLFARRDRRGRCVRSAEASRRARHRHRRRLRQGLRRAADRAQRISAGARQGALSRRAGGGGRRRRRRQRARSAAPHQVHRARTAGLLHLEGRAGARRRATAREEARQYRARRAVRTGLDRAGLRAKPTWCAKAPTTAPRSARTRWKCTRPSPNTTRCATA